MGNLRLISMGVPVIDSILFDNKRVNISDPWKKQPIMYQCLYIIWFQVWGHAVHCWRRVSLGGSLQQARLDRHGARNWQARQCELVAHKPEASPAHESLLQFCTPHVASTALIFNLTTNIFAMHINRLVDWLSVNIVSPCTFYEIIIIYICPFLNFHRNVHNRRAE
jgi:hypothetical protein